MIYSFLFTDGKSPQVLACGDFFDLILIANLFLTNLFLIPVHQ